MKNISEKEIFELEIILLKGKIHEQNNLLLLIKSEKDKTHECEMHEGDIVIVVCNLHMYPEDGKPTSSPTEELSSRSPERGSNSTLKTTRSSTDGPLNSVMSFPPDRGTTDKETQDAEQRLTTEPGQYWVPEHGIRIESALGKVVRRMPAELEDYSSCQLYRGKMTNDQCVL